MVDPISVVGLVGAAGGILGISVATIIDKGEELVKRLKNVNNKFKDSSDSLQKHLATVLSILEQYRTQRQETTIQFETIGDDGKPKFTALGRTVKDLSEIIRNADSFVTKLNRKHKSKFKALKQSAKHCLKEKDIKEEFITYSDEMNNALIRLIAANGVLILNEQKNMPDDIIQKLQRQQEEYQGRSPEGGGQEVESSSSGGEDILDGQEGPSRPKQPPPPPPPPPPQQQQQQQSSTLGDEDVLDGQAAYNMSADAAKLKVTHCNDIIELFEDTDRANLLRRLRLNEEEIEDAKERDYPHVVMGVVNRRIFNDGFCKKYPMKSLSIGVILKGFEDANLRTKKDEFKTMWIEEQQREVSKKLTVRDIDLLSEKLSAEDLTKLYHALGLKDDEIARAKGDANRCDAEQKFMNVLTYYRETYPNQATFVNILDALDSQRDSHQEDTAKDARNSVDYKKQLKKRWLPDVKLNLEYCDDIVTKLGNDDHTKLFYSLGLNDEEIGRAKKKDDPHEIMSHVVNRRVFNRGLLEKFPQKNTIGTIINGFGDARLKATQEKFHARWITEQKRQASEKFNGRDIDQLSKEVPPNDLSRLYHKFGLNDDEIAIAKGDANRSDVEQQCLNVLSHLIKSYPEKSTLGNILDALQDARNISHKEELEDKWQREDLRE